MSRLKKKVIDQDPDEIDLDEVSYNGNPLLKPAYTKVALTEEELNEYDKCFNDPIYFITNYIKIISLDDGVVFFKMWGFQKKIAKSIIKNRFSIVKLCRQSGKTTTTAAVLIWYMLFNKDYKIAVLANKVEQSQEILERIQMMYENLPKFMQQGVTRWHARRVTLENGSTVFAAATSGSAIRGKSINMVVMDEFAHIDGNLQLKFFTSTYPTITSGKTTKIIIVSTPNGFELFAKFWLEAKDGKNGYVPVEAHWSEVPGRDQAWKEETISNTSKDQFRQEYECVVAETMVEVMDKETLEITRMSIGDLYDFL